jgi:hypothetical protein
LPPLPNTPILSSQPSAPSSACIAAILKRPHGAYDAAAVAEIVEAYYQVCARGEIDPVLPLAQMVHETGNLSSWWAARPRRNPAGIGVNGDVVPGVEDERPTTGKWEWHAEERVWRAGLRFPTWKDHAVYAHVGRLLAYCLLPAKGTPAQQGLIAEALAWRPLPIKYRGSVARMTDLDGQWAVPGEGYGHRLLEVAGRLVQGGG